MGQWSTDVLRSVFALAPGPTCPLPSAQSQRRPTPNGARSSTLVLAAAAVAAGPCDAGEDKADTASATGLGATLALPAMGNGGIDFSTMELRYLADPGDGSGLQYSFSADLNPLKGDIRRSTGIAAATRSSDAFFVWLSLDPSDFWVNLNPTEPDRIVDDQLGRTDAGRILLEADLRMKQTVGKLIHPHTTLGRRYWNSLQGDCMSARNWITPAPASVHQDGDKLYILDAPLDVKMETQYLSELGGSDTTRTCPQQDQATEEHNEELYRSLILPRLKDAINTAPEYADLRRVHLARVAAEWYRERSRTKDTTYGELIDTGDITDWRTTDDWTPTDTFDKYVDSYTEGEFDVTDKTADGAKNYVYGGVDLTRISLRQVPDDRFDADFGTLPQGVDRSLRTPSAVGADDDTVWLGAPTPARRPASAHPRNPCPRAPGRYGCCRCRSSSWSCCCGVADGASMPRRRQVPCGVRQLGNAGDGRRGRDDRPALSGVVLVGDAHAGAADLKAEWGRAALRLLPHLLAAERGEVEVGVAVVELLDAAAERRVRVEDLVLDAQERADARPVTAHALRPRHSGLGQFGLGAVEDAHRRDPVVDGRVEVVVEVAARRGVPGEGPSHPFAERGERRVRGPGHRDERRVADVQLPEPADPVGRGGAAGAAGVARLLGAVGVEVEEPHEVVHDQLGPPLEQVEQAHRPVRAFEGVRLVDAHHRQPSTVGVDPVTRPGELLLLGQQLTAGGQPLLARHHLGQVRHPRHLDTPDCCGPPPGKAVSPSSLRPGRRPRRAHSKSLISR